MAVRDMSRFGTKHTCFNCGKKFYDLNKPTAVCPACGTDQGEAPAFRAPIAAVNVTTVEPVETSATAKPEEGEGDFDGGELVEEELDMEGIDVGNDDELDTLDEEDV